METKKIIERLEEAGINPDEVAEVAQHLQESKQPASPAAISGSTIQDLQERMNQEDDWRKKASLQARIISLRIELDEY